MTSFPYLQPEFIFVNPLKINNLFQFKDRIPVDMRSNLVYLYTCPRCNRGTYIGCTERMLKVRVDCHRGVSYRTCIELKKKKNSAIRDHSNYMQTKY